MCEFHQPLQRTLYHLLAACLLVALCSWMGTSASWAATPLAQAKSSLQKAQDALSSGDLPMLAEHLRALDTTLQKHKTSFSLLQRLNLQTWSSQMWSRYHQIQGVPPLFLSSKHYEERAQVRDRIALFKSKREHLRMAVRHLRSFIRTFRQVMRRSKVRDALILTSTINRVQILNNTGRTIQNRVFLLRQLDRNWGADSPVKRQARILQLTQEAKKNRKTIKKLRQGQTTIQKRLKKQAQAIEKAQLVLRSHSIRLKRRAKLSQTLLWTGAIAGTVGLASFGVGLGWYLYAGSQVGQPGITPVQIQETQQLALIPLVSGAIVAGVGVVLLIVGPAIHPGQAEQLKGLYRSQKHYLEWQEKERQRTLSTTQHTPTNTHPFPKQTPSAPFVLMGKWQ